MVVEALVIRNKVDEPSVVKKVLVVAFRIFARTEKKLVDVLFVVEAFVEKKLLLVPFKIFPFTEKRFVEVEFVVEAFVTKRLVPVALLKNREIAFKNDVVLDAVVEVANVDNPVDVPFAENSHEEVAKRLPAVKTDEEAVWKLF